MLFGKSNQFELLYLNFRYEGLSENFLSSPVPKILLLAGTDRLDRFSSYTILRKCHDVLAPCDPFVVR